MFDITKIIDTTATINTAESAVRTAAGYLPEARTRDLAHVMITAAFELARAQNQAVLSFVETVQSAAAEHTKNAA